MTNEPQSLAPNVDELDDPRVIAAVQEYLAALETGLPPARAEFLARYPAIRDELAGCLEGLDFVHQAAIDMRGPEPPTASLPLVGPVLPLGDFRILREIGRGGMGIVYEAMQLSLGRRVALKVLPFASSLDPKYLQRFKNEAQAAAQLHHTNIVPVYAVGSERGVHFYAMQLIDGEPLSVVLEDLRQLAGKSDTGQAGAPPSSGLATELALGQLAPGGPRAAAVEPTEPFAHVQLEPAPATVAAGRSSTVLTASHGSRGDCFRTIAHWFQQTATALEHAHQLGIIHRDVKPGNLIVDTRGNIWITDFGLAQFQAEANLTRTGDLLGTLRYMSPEQAQGKRVVLDHRADIYSLGVTLYELLTLEPVFAGSDRHELMRRIMEDEPQAPRTLDATIPVELETIVLKSTAKVPAERYATAQEMADDLQRFLEDKPILARRPTLRERAARWRRRHRSLIVSALVLLVLTTIGLLGSTIVIGREHLRTRVSWQREAEQRKVAEESFRQARQAVDTFTRLGEEEFADRPTLQPLRRRFLETSLAYYRSFLAQRLDDSDPSARAELAAASSEVARILDELSLLQRFAPLMLLLDEHVQDDLQLPAEDRAAVVALLTDDQASGGSSQGDETTRQQATRVLRDTYQRTSALLSPEQIERLQQLVWQQMGPFAFEHPEMVRKLSLTNEQRLRIREVIEETRPNHDQHGPGKPGHEHGPPAKPRDGERTGLVEDGPDPPDDGFRPGQPRDDGPPHGDDPPHGDGPPRDRPHGPGRGPHEHGEHGPGGHGHGGHGRGQPGAGHRGPGRHEFDAHGDGPHGPGSQGRGPHRADDRHNQRWSVWQNTIRHILVELTPEQKVQWQELVGEPLPYDLQQPMGAWPLR